MATIENVQVKISARTEDAEEGIEDVKEEALELSVAMQTAAASASQAEDEIEDAGTSASWSAAQFSGATVSLYGLNIAATTAAAGLFTLSAAFAAVATAAVGVLGILGAVGGAFGLLAVAGVVGNLKELRRAFTETVPKIKAALEPLSDVLGPLFVQAIERLPQLTRNIVAAVGGTQAFAEAARRVGNTLFRVIPPLVGLMFDIARNALPLINDAIAFLEANGPAAFGLISETLSDLGPELAMLGGALVKFLPEFVKFGTTVAEIVIPPLTVLITVVTGALSVFNSLPGVLQQVIVVAGAVAVAFGTLLGPIGAVVAAVGALAAAWRTDFLGIRSLTMDVINAISGAIDGVVSTVNGFISDIKRAVNFVKGLAAEAKKLPFVGGGGGDTSGALASQTGVRSGGPGPEAATDPSTIFDPTAGAPARSGPTQVTNITVENLNASGRAEGRRARNELEQFTGNTKDVRRST